MVFALVPPPFATRSSLGSLEGSLSSLGGLGDLAGGLVGHGGLATEPAVNLEVLKSTNLARNFLQSNQLADRMARAAINTVFNHGTDKNIFNSIDPDKDLSAMTSEGITFVQSFRNTLTALGGNPDLATVLLPDVLNYDFSKATNYAALNGRRLQDDVIDISLSLVTGGGLTTDNVGPHSDYLSEFPYLGTPH